MKQSTAVKLTIISIVSAMILLISALVIFITDLNTYGSIQRIPLIQLQQVLALLLGFLIALAAMVAAMIADTSSYFVQPKPLLLEEPEVRSDAPLTFEQRLAYELTFCDDHSTDISLVIAYIEDNASGLREKLRQYFQAAAFIYPYGTDRVAVILPFYGFNDTKKELAACFSTLFGSGDSPVISSCCGGMTSRNGRDVDAGQYIYEAEVSLERAMQEQDACVMCFQADPSAYRRALQS